MIMEKTAQFNVESVESLIDRFRVNGLETINLGLLCFRFAPALKEMNLISVLTKISKMLQTKKVAQVEDSHITSWYFNFYAGFIQYLVNRNIKFELYYSKKGKNWKERLDLALLCRQLGNYRKAYEKGDEDAPYRIGRMYERGCGVEKDEQKALEWFYKAEKFCVRRSECRITERFRGFTQSAKKKFSLQIQLQRKVA